MSNHAFIAAAQTRGITIEHAKADGKIHRVPVEGRAKSDRSGWYVLHASSATRMYGAYGRWDDGREGDTWQDGGDTKPLTKSELAAIAEARANATKQREREQREAATTALAKWDNLPSVGASPYLQRKAVEALGVRFDGEYVYIPLRDIDNSLWSLQRIAPDGAKRFHAGGRIAGCFHLIGEAKENEVLIICEGYATGATLYQATGATVACAMNCHNIGAVADALRKRYPKVTLLICADDDART